MIKFKLLLTSFATRHVEVRSRGGLFVQHFTNYYVFGFRIAEIHTKS